MAENKAFNVDNLSLEELKENYYKQIKETDIIKEDHKETLINSIKEAKETNDLKILDCFFGHTWNKLEIPYRCVVCGYRAK